jgi:hypothetical protein
VLFLFPCCPREKKHDSGELQTTCGRCSISDKEGGVIKCQKTSIFKCCKRVHKQSACGDSRASKKMVQELRRNHLSSIINSVLFIAFVRRSRIYVGMHF